MIQLLKGSIFDSKCDLIIIHVIIWEVLLPAF